MLWRFWQCPKQFQLSTPDLAEQGFADCSGGGHILFSWSGHHNFCEAIVPVVAVAHLQDVQGAQLG